MTAAALPAPMTRDIRHDATPNITNCYQAPPAADVYVGTNNAAP